MASSLLLKEHTIRRKDLRGAQEAKGAMLFMICRKCDMCSGRNISGFMRLVMRMVFVGTAGCVNGGIEDRSRVRCDPRDEARDRVGEEVADGRGDSWGDC